jgi:hypothetical protein
MKACCLGKKPKTQGHNEQPQAWSPEPTKGKTMKTTNKWLAVLAVVAALTTAQTSRAITYGEADGNLHPSVGAWMVNWPDGIRTNFASGTLIHKFTNPDGTATGIFLTAGHVTADVQTAIDEGSAEWDYIKINFNPDPWYHPEQDVRVLAVFTYLVQRSNLGAWDDVGVAILEAEKVEDLPEPAELAPVGFLDQFKQSELHDCLLVAVGYGASVSPPPGGLVFGNTRNFSTPKYVNFSDRVVQLQANGRAGNSGFSIGDSGGPLFWKDPQTGREIVVGINYAVNGGYSNVGSIDYSYRTDTQVVHDFLNPFIEQP